MVTEQRAARRLGVLGALLLAGVGLLLHVPAAQAATRTVTLSTQGPSPSAITIAKGDVVRFLNSDSVTHTITHTKGAWTFKAAIAAGKSATTTAFIASGTYNYKDEFVIAVVPQTASGSIVVPVAAPSPSATPSPRPSSTPIPTRSPSAAATASSAASSSPSPAPNPTGTGTAIGPGLDVLSPPSPAPGQTLGPQPNVAPPAASGSSAAVAGGPSYGGKAGVVQGSAHRYGLPAALALVAITGLLSLLVRLLLAEPAARRRRTVLEVAERV